MILVVTKHKSTCFTMLTILSSPAVVHFPKTVAWIRHRRRPRHGCWSSLPARTVTTTVSCRFWLGGINMSLYRPLDGGGTGGGVGFRFPINKDYLYRNYRSERIVPWDDHDDGRPPPYHKHQMAVEVFSNPYFYYDQVVADAVRKEREAVLKDWTVGDLYQKYVQEWPEGKEQGMKVLADCISARITRINSFLDPVMEPVEDTLARMDIISFPGTPEITFSKKQGFILDLPTTDSVWEDHANQVKYQDPPRRSLPLCLVLGPSGSGKTWFALKYLREQALVPPGKKVVTVYLYPGSVNIDFSPISPLAAQELIDKVRQQCAKQSRREISEKLDMHVCLVLDQAGFGDDCKSWFESKAMLETLCREASEKLASSVTVIVTGTGLSGHELNPSTDAFVFRMKPWQAKDLTRIAARKVEKLRLVEDETIETVARAIFAHPKLGALATNARAACFLSDAVAILSSTYSRVSWDLQLKEWAQTLIPQVVDGYIGLSFIRGLKSHGRRRVAASVFHAMQRMKQGDTSLPSFSELEEREILAADSLLEYNLERTHDDVLKIRPGKDFAFTLTPALVLILYSMAGVYTTAVPGEKSHVELAALYALRQSMIQCMEKFVCDVGQGLDRQDCLKELDESLEKVRLVKLQEQLQSNSDNVIVPILDGETIIMNGDGALFADVIAPYTLIQAKHTTDPLAIYDVNLYEEMEKCGLVDNSDTRLLRGLIVMWQNTISGNTIRDKSTQSSQSTLIERNPQFSKAFPENVVSGAPSKDPIRNAVIEGPMATGMTLDNGETTIPLPELDGTTIRFMLSTNAKQLRLDLGPSTPQVIITEAHLDDDLEIKVDTLEKEEQPLWTSFRNDRLRDGVKVMFLFTSGAS